MWFNEEMGYADLNVKGFDGIVEPLANILSLLLGWVHFLSCTQTLLGIGLCLGFSFNHFKPLHLLHDTHAHNVTSWWVVTPCSGQIKTCLLTVSMSFLFSTKELLSLISADWIQDLIWSRSLCSFLISFLRSVSYFSFWLLLAALWTFCQISSKSSTPSVTFFRHLSISPVEKS